MSDHPELDWATELGPLQDGDIELMEDAINALESGDGLSVDHALHGLRKRVEAARALLSPAQPAGQVQGEPVGVVDQEGGVEWMRGPMELEPGTKLYASPLPSAAAPAVPLSEEQKGAQL